MRATPDTGKFYQHVIARGLPYERGLAHGRQAAAKISDNVAYYKMPGKLAELDVYIPNIAEFYPAALEEMRGIAVGAGVTLEDVVLLNARYDLARLNRKKRSEYRPQSDTYLRLHGPSSGYTEEEDDDGSNECTSAFFLGSTTTTGDIFNVQN
ncbi:hypothetical protein LRP88_07335 [Fusarium phalaenopsidis]|nr:Peptidase C45 acyl-coenzyme A:6-aminopenicillanic acid acyl-transferase [Fusarium sp. Ph1]